MIPRPSGFLKREHIDHDSEVFKYIAELHDYLWQFVRIVNPAASGYIDEYVDDALAKLKASQPEEASTCWHASADACRSAVIEECAKAIEPANHPLLMAAVKAIRALKSTAPQVER